MKEEDIEVTLLHNPRFNEKANGFFVNVLINKKDINPLELTQDQLLHIGAILLNASNTFIQQAKNVEKNDKGRSNTYCK